MKYTRKNTQQRFNKFIRLRDSIEYDFRFFKCISSGLVLPVKSMQAGHFYHFNISGSLTFDEINLNGQSAYDNLTSGTNPEVFNGYRKGLIEKYGSGVFDYLDSKKKNKTKFDQLTLKTVYDYYTNQIKLIESGQYVDKQREFK